MYEEQLQEVYAAHQIIQQSGKDLLDNTLITFKAAENAYIVREKRINNAGLTIEHIHVVDRDGKKADGTQVEMDYRFYVNVALMDQYDWIKCFVNSTTKYSTLWAQLGVALPPLSVEHPKYYFGEVPVSAPIQFVHGMNLSDVIYQELYELFKYGNPKKCTSAFVPKMESLTWGTNLKQTITKSIALECLAEHAWEINKECNGCVEYLPYALVDEIYRAYNE